MVHKYTNKEIQKMNEDLDNLIYWNGEFIRAGIFAPYSEYEQHSIKTYNELYLLTLRMIHKGFPLDKAEYKIINKEASTFLELGQILMRLHSHFHRAQGFDKPWSDAYPHLDPANKLKLYLPKKQNYILEIYPKLKDTFQMRNVMEEINKIEGLEVSRQTMKAAIDVLIENEILEKVGTDSRKYRKIVK